jgi:hypothetical protein
VCIKISPHKYKYKYKYKYNFLVNMTTHMFIIITSIRLGLWFVRKAMNKMEGGGQAPAQIYPWFIG